MRDHAAAQFCTAALTSASAPLVSVAGLAESVTFSAGFADSAGLSSGFAGVAAGGATGDTVAAEGAAAAGAAGRAGSADATFVGSAGLVATAAGLLPGRALMQARGRPLSAAQLHDSLYGFDGEVESNTVNVHVHHLRRKLGADVIETVRGAGYRFSTRI